MSTTLSKVFIFALGAGIGSLVTWKIVKTKYEQIAQEEIDSVIEKFAPRKEREEEKEVAVENDVPKTDEKPDFSGYSSVLNDLGYTNYASSSTETKEVPKVKEPYVIPPEEFGYKEDEGYETETLYYYKDKVLADEHDNRIEDVEGAVGYDSLTHFGEYEDDSVFVRNEQRKIDYEILLSERRYSDVIMKNPRLAEGE